MKRKVLLALGLAGCMALTAPVSVFAEAEEVQEETVEETPEEAAEEVAEEAAAEEGSALSDDLYSFSVQINGEIYQLPMLYSEFMEKGGWEVSKYYQGQEEDMLIPNSYTYIGLVNGENEISIDLVNYDINEVMVKDCYVGGIEIDGSYDFDTAAVEVVLPGGIKMGEANMEAVQAAYGTPSDTYEGDQYTKITYEKDIYEEVALYVYKEGDVLNQIDIRYFAEPEGFVVGEVSKEVPDFVTNYKAPEALTDDFTDPIVEYFGDLYQLPAPVCAFTTNGWTLDDISEDDYVAGDGFAAVNMRKDNQSIRFYLYNDSHNATAYENCMVRELSFYTYDNEVIDMKLSGGVTLGANADELMAAAKENGYYVEDKMEDGYLTVSKTEDDKYKNNVEFWINTKEDAVAIAGIDFTNRGEN